MKKLKIPHFWYSQDEDNHSPFLSKILWPATKLYQGISYIDRIVTVEKKSPLPVICVGNLTMGGAGKTPTARAILSLIAEHGKFATPCFLMRGYGGNVKGPLEVDPTQHTAWDVGDEALMQAQHAPVIVSSDRYQGAMLAKNCGYDLIVMDDGFQNPKLKKDLSFIVVDGGFSFGNNCCFPSGPLREPVAIGAKRANAAIVINRDEHTDVSALGSLKQFNAKISLKDKIPEGDKRKVVAFAGISRPEKFFNTLEQHGYNLYAHYSFPDHHIFTHGELKTIEDRAKNANVSIITTEKDWIRLSETWRKKISTLAISVDLDAGFKNALYKFLDRL